MKTLPKIDYLLIDLIASCNLNCLHCRASGFDKKSFLSFEDLKKLFNDAKTLGVKTITFSGGEPFLREDLFEIIKFIKEAGFILRIQSNCLLLDESKISKLKELGVDWVGTGIDGLEMNHDKLRNKSGSFKKVLENIRLLKKYGIKIHVEFTATAFNYLDFEEIVKLCARLEVYDIMTRAVLPFGKGKEFSFALTKERYAEYLKEIIRLKKENIDIKLCCQDPVYFSLDKEGSNNLLKKYSDKRIIGGCSAAINMLYISPEGNVQPCSFLNVSLGNIKNKNLKEIIYSAERASFLDKQIKREFNSKCKNCLIRFICGGCRARALDFTGNLWGDDPFCFKK